jgi:galactofuranose transport system ATP-binding protein
VAEDSPVVDIQGITVTFPGVTALADVDFRLFPGEVHALLGENGAGKSTLIKALTGENILLGREPRRFGSIDGRAMRARAAELLSRIGLHVDPGSALGSHPIAVQQLVAIARAVAVDARVLILDEPTSSLDAGEVAELFRIMRVLREDGVAILFVSHFLDQVYEIADRLTVLRNGAVVGEHATTAVSRLELVRAMIGRDLSVLDEVEQISERRVPSDAPLLQAQNLGRTGAIAPFDLELHSGEVVGVAGLLGSGRTELARLLFGADHADSGRVLLDGRPVRLRTPRQAIAKRIAFTSEDRKAEGLVADLTVRDNLILAMQAARGWHRQVPRRTADELVEKYVHTLDIRPSNPDAVVATLSGGNQQKVLLARWLVTQPRLLILDEPTRGIDVGAKAQIQKVVADLAAEGMAVLFISAELEEVMRVSDRVVVLRDRRKIGELPGESSVDDVLALIAGEAEKVHT